MIIDTTKLATTPLPEVVKVWGEMAVFLLKKMAALEKDAERLQGEAMAALKATGPALYEGLVKVDEEATMVRSVLDEVSKASGAGAEYGSEEDEDQ